MLKINELNRPESRLNKAKDFELLFVLLERDICAPATIRFWAHERMRLGKNVRGDAQIQEAYDTAAIMDERRLANAEVTIV